MKTNEIKAVLDAVVNERDIDMDTEGGITYRRVGTSRGYIPWF